MQVTFLPRGDWMKNCVNLYQFVVCTAIFNTQDYLLPYTSATDNNAKCCQN